MYCRKEVFAGRVSTNTKYNILRATLCMAYIRPRYGHAQHTQIDRRYLLVEHEHGENLHIKWLLKNVF